MNTVAHPALQARMDQYHREKPVGDIDLVQEVRNILIEAGLINNVNAFFNTHPQIVEAEGKISDVQRFLLNRYWDMQLRMCHNSMDARYNLLPKGTIEDWIRLFKAGVMPMIVQNNLPKPLTL